MDNDSIQIGNVVVLKNAVNEEQIAVLRVHFKTFLMRLFLLKSSISSTTCYMLYWNFQKILDSWLSNSLLYQVYYKTAEQ